MLLTAGQPALVAVGRFSVRGGVEKRVEGRGHGRRHLRRAGRLARLRSSTPVTTNRPSLPGEWPQGRHGRKERAWRGGRSRGGVCRRGKGRSGACPPVGRAAAF